MTELPASPRQSDGAATREGAADLRRLRRRPLATLALLRQDAVDRELVEPKLEDFDPLASFWPLPWKPVSEEELCRLSDLDTAWWKEFCDRAEPELLEWLPSIGFDYPEDYPYRRLAWEGLKDKVDPERRAWLIEMSHEADAGHAPPGP